MDHIRATAKKYPTRIADIYEALQQGMIAVIDDYKEQALIAEKMAMLIKVFVNGKERSSFEHTGNNDKLRNRIMQRTYEVRDG